MASPPSRDVNTAQELDGSDSATSRGRIRITARSVKVPCDVTISFPLVVSQPFAKDVKKWKTGDEGGLPASLMT